MYHYGQDGRAARAAPVFHAFWDVGQLNLADEIYFKNTKP